MLKIILKLLNLLNLSNLKLRRKKNDEGSGICCSGGGPAGGLSAGRTGIYGFRIRRMGIYGFGLSSVIIGLLIITVMIASAIPYLEGFYELKQAESAVNAANSLIKAEIQYQQADYSNYAEKNTAPANDDYFGTVAQLMSGMNILPNNNLQQFLPEGISLSLVDYQGNNNCINKPIGGGLTECLNDEENGQFELFIYGLNNSNLSRYVPMFENGIKGGLSAYSGGLLTAQISVPFGFSAYPKIQNGNGGGGGGNTTNNYYGGGGGGAAVPNVQCTEWGGGGNCEQYTYSNGAKTSNLNGYYNNPGSVCTEVSPDGTCLAWSR